MKKTYLWLIILLCSHLFILSKLQFTAWPEMVSFPYLINHGFVTFKDMIHAYPPLLVNVLAFLYKIFGYKVIVLEIFGWSSILVGDVLVFFILKKLIKRKNLVILGLSLYVVLQAILEGNMVWPDINILPFLLLTFFLLINKKYFWSGVSVALAFLTKQTGIIFMGIGFLYIVFYERNYKKIINYIVGILLVVVPFLFNLIVQKSFVDFINWTIIYPSKYWTKFPGYVQLIPTLREDLVLFVLFVPLAILVFKAKKKIFNDKQFILLFGFFVAGIVGVYPRFSFFHFQAALAFLIILYIYLGQNLKKNIVYLLFLVPILVLVLSFKSLQFGEARFWDNNDLELGNLIQSETTEDKPVYFLGLNSSQYAFSNRLPNKPWLDNFGWYLEIPGVQNNVLDSFRSNPPSTIFWQTPQEGNWYDIGVYQPRMITNYIVNNYTKVKEIQKGVWEWKRN